MTNEEYAELISDEQQAEIDAALEKAAFELPIEEVEKLLDENWPGYPAPWEQEN